MENKRTSVAGWWWCRCCCCAVALVRVAAGRGMWPGSRLIDGPTFGAVSVSPSAL